MKDSAAVSEREIAQKICVIRNEQVMLDTDLAEMYGVETKYLKRQVRRNIGRFPEDFMFELNQDEMNDLRCQKGTSRWGGSRYRPMAFTEQGVAQLSSVLSSGKAIVVNIQIIRSFTRMRKLLMTQQELLLKIEQMDGRLGGQDDKIRVLFNYIRKLIDDKSVIDDQKSRVRIGFVKKAVVRQSSTHRRSLRNRSGQSSVRAD